MSYGNSAYEKLWRVADRAYSEIAWAVQDIASGRIDRSQQKDYRSQRLAEMADELRKVLDEAQPEGVT